VRVAHHRADVEVVFPVLDRHVERVPPGIQVRDDRVHGPIPVPVDDVPAIARLPHFGIQPVVVRPRFLDGPDPHLGRVVVVRHGAHHTLPTTTAKIYRVPRASHPTCISVTEPLTHSPGTKRD